MGGFRTRTTRSGYQDLESLDGEAIVRNLSELKQAIKGYSAGRIMSILVVDGVVLKANESVHIPKRKMPLLIRCVGLGSFNQETGQTGGTLFKTYGAFDGFRSRLILENLTVGVVGGETPAFGPFLRVLENVENSFDRVTFDGGDFVGDGVSSALLSGSLDGLRLVGATLSSMDVGTFFTGNAVIAECDLSSSDISLTGTALNNIIRHNTGAGDITIAGTASAGNKVMGNRASGTKTIDTSASSAGINHIKNNSNFTINPGAGDINVDNV